MSGLSGWTFELAVSWGKVKRVASKAQVFSDATITVPLGAGAEDVGEEAQERAGVRLKGRQAGAEI